jgi:hypothetical protein
MLVALGVMFVTALLMVAAFQAADGDIHLTQRDSAQKQAYYAALAGVQEYEYRLQANPDYWETCEAPSKEIQETSGKENEHYEIKLLVASTAPKGTTECSKTNPYGTMIQATGAEANTFRIDSIGTAGKPGTTGYETREIVATYRVVGFLDYAYFTQYEDEDPSFVPSEPKWCGEDYRPKRKELEEKTGESCVGIVFAKEDSISGPVHTDDEALICGEVSFGREGHNPADVVEFNHGWENGGCGGGATPKFNTSTKNYTVGTELFPPEGDTSLGTYVKEAPGGLEFKGVTKIELKGETSKLLVTSEGKTKEYGWPENGLVYVRTAGACGYKYNPDGSSDNTAEETEETGCGTVYVKGTYSKSITIGAEEAVVINGNIYPTSVKTLGEEPTGTDTAGLIAGSSVRIYHPLTGANSGNGKCSTSDNASGSLENPYIYAAILSTNHSFIVDNFNCGQHLGNLNIYGAIAQKFRGIVGETRGTGYTKDYKYDQRLAVDEPPYFLNPINAGWEVSRETAPHPS